MQLQPAGTACSRVRGHAGLNSCWMDVVKHSTAGYRCMWQVNRLLELHENKLEEAKNGYQGALHRLEQISTDVHDSRQANNGGTLVP